MSVVSGSDSVCPDRLFEHIEQCILDRECNDPYLFNALSPESYSLLFSKLNTPSDNVFEAPIIQKLIDNKLYNLFNELFEKRLVLLNVPAINLKETITVNQKKHPVRIPFMFYLNHKYEHALKLGDKFELPLLAQSLKKVEDIFYSGETNKEVQDRDSIPAIAEQRLCLWAGKELQKYIEDQLMDGFSFKGARYNGLAYGVGNGGKEDLILTQLPQARCLYTDVVSHPNFRDRISFELSDFETISTNVAVATNVPLVLAINAVTTCSDHNDIQLMLETLYSTISPGGTVMVMNTSFPEPFVATLMNRYRTDDVIPFLVLDQNIKNNVFDPVVVFIPKQEAIAISKLIPHEILQRWCLGEMINVDEFLSMCLPATHSKLPIIFEKKTLEGSLNLSELFTEELIQEIEKAGFSVVLNKTNKSTSYVNDPSEGSMLDPDFLYKNNMGITSRYRATRLSLSEGVSSVEKTAQVLILKKPMVIS